MNLSLGYHNKYFNEKVTSADYVESVFGDNVIAGSSFFVEDVKGIFFHLSADPFLKTMFIRYPVNYLEIKSRVSSFNHVGFFIVSGEKWDSFDYSYKCWYVLSKSYQKRLSMFGINLNSSIKHRFDMRLRNWLSFFSSSEEDDGGMDQKNA